MKPPTRGGADAPALVPFSGAPSCVEFPNLRTWHGCGCGSYGLTAISDRKVFHFAQGLKEPDARQLRRVLIWQVRSRG